MRLIIIDEDPHTIVNLDLIMRYRIVPRQNDHKWECWFMGTDGFETPSRRFSTKEDAQTWLYKFLEEFMNLKML